MPELALDTVNIVANTPVLVVPALAVEVIATPAVDIVPTPPVVDAITAARYEIGADIRSPRNVMRLFMGTGASANKGGNEGNDNDFCF